MQNSAFFVHQESYNGSMKVSSKKSRKQKILNLATNFLLLCGVVAVSLISFMPKSQPASTTQASVIYEGNRQSNCVSLMINVYWGTEYIHPMLKVLEEKGVKTTFFVGGMWVSENPEVLKQIASSGHEIGNHGYNHKDHDKLSESANCEEIVACNNVIKSVLGFAPMLFAPPSGAYNKTTVSVASALSMKTIMWTRDTIDWRDKDAALICSRALKDVKGGDLVLMHPTQKTLEALPAIIDGILQKGLTVATVSQTIA